MCTYSVGSFSVVRPSAVGVTADIVPQQCYGTNSGSVTLTGTGGQGGTYQFTFNHGTAGTTNSFSSLAPGNYDVFVTDSNNCPYSTTVTVPSTTAVAVGASAQPSCSGGSNGQITITASGGTSSGYQYSVRLRCTILYFTNQLSD